MEGERDSGEKRRRTRRRAGEARDRDSQREKIPIIIGYSVVKAVKPRAILIPTEVSPSGDGDHKRQG